MHFIFREGDIQALKVLIAANYSDKNSQLSIGHKGNIKQLKIKDKILFSDDLLLLTSSDDDAKVISSEANSIAEFLSYPSIFKTL